MGSDSYCEWRRAVLQRPGWNAHGVQHGSGQMSTVVAAMATTSEGVIDGAVTAKARAAFILRSMPDKHGTMTPCSILAAQPMLPRRRLSSTTPRRDCSLLPFVTTAFILRPTAFTGRVSQSNPAERR